MSNKRENDRDKYDTNYRQIEAMYYKGLSNEEIISQSRLSKLETLNIIQTICGRDKMKTDRRRV